MKGLVHLPVSLAVVLALAPGCRSSPPPAMPAWSPESVELVAAAAVLDIDDDGMRVPRDDEPRDIWPASGLYVGGALITSQPLGDFDGDDALAGPTDVVFVPDLEVGAGVGLYLSHRWHMDELVVQYSITEHDGEFSNPSRELDSTFKDFDVNWRHYFWERSPLQPYTVLGVGVSTLEIENGSTDQATLTQMRDAELGDGINVNVGLGAALYTLPWVVFYGQGIYRFGRYKTSEGIDGEFDNTPDIDGDTWSLSFGAALRLLPSRR